MKTDTTTLISALKILARDIESGDGVENACIAEGADRLEELNRDAKRYCFLRERDLNTIQIGGDFAGQVPENYVLNLDDLDAAVDEAITKVESEAA